MEIDDELSKTFFKLRIQERNEDWKMPYSTRFFPHIFLGMVVIIIASATAGRFIYGFISLFACALILLVLDMFPRKVNWDKVKKSIPDGL